MKTKKIIPWILILSIIMLSGIIGFTTSIISKTNTNRLILGERINGQAVFYDTINGKPLFTLNDYVLVETAPTVNNWLIAGLFVKLTIEQISSSKILPNSILLGKDGKVAGKTSDTVEVGMSYDSLGLIRAYTPVKSIDPSTIVENELEKLLLEGKTKKSQLEPFMANFKFEKLGVDTFTNLTQYCIYESPLVDLSPRDRITLLFNNENNLLGVVHTRLLDKYVDISFELIRGHELIITLKMPEDEIQRIINERNNFYNSID
ncbi:MAG: hypothetical protein J0M08_04135 [Bacteroidetes bacterium]|nr:hypothetical protein [Bacteroidota bacterium]